MKRFGSLVALMVVLTASALAHGQAISSNGGSIQGVISDPTGAAIPGAQITVSDSEIGYSHRLTSDSAGFYSIGPLVPGAYTIIIQAPSFSTLKVSTVIKTGTVTSGNEKLSLGNTNTTVEVNAGAVQINTEQIGLASVISQAQIDSLPINGRNILDIAQLEPGVILQPGTSFDPTKAGYSALSVGGVGGRTTRILLDGQDITDETVGTTLFNTPTGAIGDFQINRSTQDVSGEVTSTGQVLISTRSGTNDFHGQLFYNFQDHSVGFANVQGHDAPFQRNQFGGSIGGPIVKDKLFFFADVERLKQDEQDAALASSIFSDPTQAGPYLGTPILTKYPLIPAPFRDLYATARVDYNAPFGVHLFARAVYSSNADTANFGDLYSIYKNRDIVPALVGGADFTTGRFTHSIRGGYEKFHNLLGDVTAQYASSLYTSPGYTLFGPGGFYSGINSLAPQQTYQSDKQLRYDGTYTRGKNSFKFGGEINRIDGGGFADFYGSAIVSVFGPGSLLANCGGNPANGPCAGDPLNGYATEEALIGNGNGLFSEKPAFGGTGGGVFSWRFAAYGADTIKATSWLTLTAGLRWSVDTDRANQDLPTPLCNQLSLDIQFTGCTGATPLFNQYQAGLGTKVHQPYANFGPQAGFVISPGNHKLSIRGGAGIYYENDIFNNTGNTRPAVIPATTSGAFFNLAFPCSNYFPGSTLNNPTGAGQSLGTICSESQASALPGFNSIRSQYQGQTKNVNSPNPNFIGTDSGGDLVANNIYAGPYKTPYAIEYSVGVQREIKNGIIVSVDYVHNSTLKVPLSIDVNRLGAARTLNTAAAQSAISATTSGFGCAGGFTTAAIDCAIAAGAQVTDFALNGLESGDNGYNVSGQPATQTGVAFGGLNRNVGLGKFVLPIGKSGYDALQAILQGQKSHPLPGIVSSNFQLSYSLSRIVTMTGGGTEDQFFAGAPAWDYDNPHNYIGRSALDHTNQVTFGAAFVMKYGAHVGFTGHFFSAPPTSLTLDATTYSGIGEIFRTDVTGDGTVGDLLPTTVPGAYEHSVKPRDLNTLIGNWNAQQANTPTPAGNALINAGLFNLGELQAINAVKPLLAAAPGIPLSNAALRVFDLNISYPIRHGLLHFLPESFSVEPGVSFYNLFNMSNFGSPSGVLLTQADANGSINTQNPGYLAGPSDQNSLSTEFRTERASGTFDQGAPRSTEFQLKLNF